MPLRGFIQKSCVLVGLCVLALGCPPKTEDQQVALLVSPSVLDFGMEGDEPQTFIVRTNQPTPTLPPFVAQPSNASKGWLRVSPAAGESTGPRSPQTFVVTVDRTKLRAGENVGAVHVSCEGLVTRTVTVKARSLMAADFVADPIEIFEGEEVQIEDLSAVAPGEPPITSWTWDFGDGTPPQTLLRPDGPKHTYMKPDLMTVRLTTRSAAREDTETKEQYINVKRKVAPTAAFVVSNRTPNANTPVTFTDQSLPGTAEITSWLWDFGDGQTSVQRNPEHTYAMGGTYTVTLTVTSAHGTNTGQALHLMQVTQTKPVADFVLPPGPLLAGVQNPVQFTDTSNPGTSAITKWAWNFGDGSTSTEQHPSHAYIDAVDGGYDVTLTVTTPHGTSSVTKKVLIEERAPQANFTVSDQNPLVNTAVTFTDLSDAGTSPITKWEWNFGDGTPIATSQNPVHTYTKHGRFTVSLKVTTGHGSHTETKTQYMNVRTIAPTPDFSATPLVTYAGKPVSFTDQSQPGTAEITSWEWNFGDGSPISREQHPTHVYSEPNEPNEPDRAYTVSLKVKTAHAQEGVTATKTAYILVKPPVKPTAQFTVSPRNVYEGDTVSFTDTSLPGSSPITSWLWTFGDGESSTERNPQHIYGTPGTYTISLKVLTSDGEDTLTRFGYVVVKPNTDPTADFEAQSTDPLMGDVVRFTDLSNRGTAASITSWLWNFGDPFCEPTDNISSEQNPSHIYAEPGLYTVSLKVVTAHGQHTATKTQYIRVRPRVDFSANPTLATVGKEVKFTDLTTVGSGTIASWLWDFGDGFTSTLANPSHVYGMAGTYDVTLTVTLAQGVTASLTKPAYVKTEIKGPTADFTVSNFNPVMFEAVAFTDLSDPGSSAITRWRWEFGDGTTSNAQHPFHTYTKPSNPGTNPPEYTVKLTVWTPFAPPEGVSATKVITVGGPQPTAKFTQDKTVVLRTDDPNMPIFDPVTFTSTSTISGTGYIFQYQWRIWQGDPNAIPPQPDIRSFSPIFRTAPSNTLRRNPFHEAGHYNVALTILATTMTDPGDPNNPENVTHFIGNTVVKANAVEVREASELDLYLRMPEPASTYTLYGSPIIGDGYKAFVLNLTSLTWQAPGRPSPEPWRHWLTVIQPDQLQGHQTGLLYLDGGVRNEPAPRSVDPLLADFAVKSGSIVAILRGVPNQPFTPTTGESAGIALSEDALIAETMRRFMHQPWAEPQSLALFPMVKCASKAMDAVQRLMATPSESGNYPAVLVPKFYVAGGSETGWSRGWATYLVAASDPRVRGIIPMSFDGVNMYEQCWHYLASGDSPYGGQLPPALEDYAGIAWTLDHPSNMGTYLTLRDRRRRIERLLREIQEQVRDDYRAGPVDGNNHDGLAALRHLLRKKNPEDPPSFAVLSAIAYARYYYPGVQPLEKAATYGDLFWTHIDAMLERGGEPAEKRADDIQVAGNIYGGDVLDFYLYQYTLAPTAPNPPEKPEDFIDGSGWYLVELMRQAEEQILQHERSAWMQYMIDPIMYNDAYTPVLEFASPFGARLRMPKYILLGTGDEASWLEAPTFYFGLLNQEKWLRYYVGATHDLGGFEQALYDALPWYQRAVNGLPQPRFDWEFDSTGQQITVRVPEGNPTVKLWRCYSTTGDFRTVPGQQNPQQWSSLELAPDPQGIVFVQIYPNLDYYTAYFIELTYSPESGSGPDQVFTTDIRIIPPYTPPLKAGGQPVEGAPPAGQTEAPPDPPAP